MHRGFIKEVAHNWQVYKTCTLECKYLKYSVYNYYRNYNVMLYTYADYWLVDIIQLLFLIGTVLNSVIISLLVNRKQFLYLCITKKIEISLNSYILLFCSIFHNQNFNLSGDK